MDQEETMQRNNKSKTAGADNAKESPVWKKKTFATILSDRAEEKLWASSLNELTKKDLWNSEAESEHVQED